ncbi:Gfo/Idh/MocA family oxidoreductase [Pedobacter sp. JY14-1]|uniref:Gfo/Idh/MocA family protein n=1 Tax=Pedobacter sp. JY14-1 TaxID=3034151 RepID=UPI0023E15061|nr:Gfo/Idh/MocA family oxidoreductase [Pedobacter sp. JY14-1]
MNVLIVGFGSIARKHINALKAIGLDCRLFALRSDFNVKYYEGIENIFDLNQLPVKPDFAIISNPTKLHAKYIELLSDSHIPLFIEKPPVSNLDDAEKLDSKVKSSGLFTYVACNLRFHPCIQYVKNHLSKGHRRINEINVYCGSYLPEWRPGQDFRSIYSANSEMGGGVHLDLFHELDYLHWIFGAPVSVKSVKTNRSSLNISAIDYANYILDYRSFSASVILNYFRREPKRTFEIVYEDKTWHVDLLKNKIVDGAGDAIFTGDDSYSINETYLAQMQYFIDCLGTNRLPMNTFKDSIEVLHTCLTDE